MDVRLRPAVSARLPAIGALVPVLVCVVMLAGPGAASGHAPAGSAGPPSGASRAGAGPTDGWVWPLSGSPPVVRGFDPPDLRWEAGHRGVDLLAEPGSIVRAAGGGLVSFAGPLAGRGVVSVRHRDGTRTTYQPLVVDVVRGDRVEAGHPLGRLSAAGGHCAPQACLHWGRLRGEVYLDPLALLGRGPVRLLPVWGPVHGPAAARAPGTTPAEVAER
ncbi:MAG: peptidoglycan DD-metalloendopeptidase family protein, partial [Actinomycetes bacterium]